MRWLLTRTLMLWLALIALCAVGIWIGKLDRRPDGLQMLGFDRCDGEPCYRGVRLEMDWREAQQRIVDARVESRDHVLDPNSADDFLSVPINSGDLENIELTLWKNHRVKRMTVNAINVLPVTVGEVVTRYGIPCKVTLWHYQPLKYYYGAKPGFGLITLAYPNLEVGVYVLASGPQNPNDVRLALDAPVKMFTILNNELSCRAQSTDVIGTWSGFTTGEVYQRRFADAASLKPRMPALSVR